MIDFFNKDNFQNIWSKLKAGAPAKMSPDDFDSYIKLSQEESTKRALEILSVGNMQITHVTPEVDLDDLESKFNSDIFYTRSLWVKQNPSKARWIVSDILLKDIDEGFYLVGKSGCGKTSFAKSCAFYLQEKGGIRALNHNGFIKFVNFGKLLNSLGRDNWIYKTYILDEISKAEILFLDDLGSERFNETNDQILFEIIHNRLHRTRTFFTSNTCIDELPYKESTIRRIRDMIVDRKEIEVAPYLKQQKPPSPDVNGNFSNS